MNNLSIEELKDARIMYKVRRDLVAITIIDELIAILELKGEQVPVEGGLLPCPFCAGNAIVTTIENEDDACFGGDVITCSGCGASSHVEFGRKENLASAWNTRAESPKLGLVRLSKDVREFLQEAINDATQCEDGDMDHGFADQLSKLLSPLFTAPQKPVVLPHGHKPYLVRSQTTAPRAAMTANGDWLHRDQVVEAIEAAGGIVKDGE